MISDLILIAKKFSVPSAYGRRDGVRDFFTQYPDGVYIATDAGAPAGWEGYAVWFGGTGERYAERFMELIRDGYIVERFLRARVGGLLVFTFRCRLKMRRFGTLGKPHGEPDALNFYMPNGGTIILNKIGLPTVVELEYSLDGGATWTVWPEDGSGNRSLTLTAGQRMYIRNTSETSTGFSLSGNDYYNFNFSGITEAHGKINSLLCKNENNASISPSCFRGLFYLCVNITTAPQIPFTVTEDSCYRAMFSGCSNLLEAPILYANKIETGAYRGMFYDCVFVNKIYTYMNDITAYECLYLWLGNTSLTGDFYCPAELTIPTGLDGIPAGWTRHDI